MRTSNPSALLGPQGGKCHPLPDQGLWGIFEPTDQNTEEERGLLDAGSDLSQQDGGEVAWVTREASLWYPRGAEPAVLDGRGQ